MEERQPSRCLAGNTGRVVQIVPIRTAQLASIFSTKVVQPTRIVLGELAYPVLLVYIAVQVDVTRGKANMDKITRSGRG